MAEVYPSDSELLDLLADSETGVEYIPTGTAPYYLHFRKLLYRLLLATKRANDFRLYHEGGLSFGIKPGKYWNNNTAVVYPGSTGNAMYDDSTKEIFLDGDGVLYLLGEGYFEASNPTVPEIRLARVTAANGVIINIEDCRDYHSIATPFYPRKTVTEHTADASLSHNDSGTIHTNAGATGTVTLYLPSTSLAGTEITFVLQENFDLRVDPLSNNIKMWSGGGTPGWPVHAGTIGDLLTLVSDGNGNWIPTAKDGVWAMGV